MEKFTKWADKGTSVNPFLPPRPPSTSLPAKALSLTGGLLLLTLRIPFLLTSLAWLTIAALLAYPLTNLAGGLGLLAYAVSQGKPELQQPAAICAGTGLLMLLFAPLQRFLALVLLRPPVGFLLRVLGLTFVEQHANLRKLGLRPPGSKPPTGAVGASVAAGDLLLSNHTSALDVLYVASRFLPAFVAVAGVAPQVSFERLSGWGAFCRAMRVPSREGKGTASLPTLLAQARREGRPLAMFPEVARSNGEGVLAFPQGVFESLGQQQQEKAPVRTHVFAFSAPKGGVLASHIVGSPASFLLRLLTSWRTTVLVTYVAAEDAPQLATTATAAKGKRPAATMVAPSARVCASPQAWGEEVRGLLSAMLGKPKLGLGLPDFLTFTRYWTAIRRGHTAVAGRLADARDKI